MDTTLRYFSSRRKYFGFLLLSVVMSAGGLWMLTDATKTQDRVVGWLLFGFFALCSAIFLRVLFDRRPRLLLDADGLNDRRLRVGPIAWSDIAGAELQSIVNQLMIALEVRDPDKYLQGRPGWVRSVGRLNKTFGFAPFNVSLAGLDVEPRALLEQIQRRIAAAPRVAPEPTVSLPVATRTQAFDQAVPEMDDFADRLERISPTAWVVPGLVAINAIVFGLVTLGGGNLFAPGTELMVKAGANFGPLTTGGEWWRLGSSMFLHFGLLHVALNMWALYSVGRLVERLFGSGRFLVLYTVAGLAGSMASVLWNPGVISAGASGAVFGVFGALLAFVLKPGNRLPASLMRGHLSSTLGFVAFNLFYGAAHAGIDNAAHVGGLVGGLLMGFLLARPFDEQARRQEPMHRLALALVAGVALLAALAWPLAHPGEGTRNAQEFRRALLDFGGTESRALDRFKVLVDQGRSKALDDAAVGSGLQAEVIPMWQSLHDRLAGLDVSADPQLLALQKSYLEYVDHRRDAMAALAVGFKEERQDKMDEGQRLLDLGEADIKAITQAHGDGTP